MTIIEVVNKYGTVCEIEPKNIAALDALKRLDDEMRCSAQSNEDFPWLCTRKEGHKGAHVAHGSSGGTLAIFAKGATP